MERKLHVSLEPCGFKLWPCLCRDAVLSLAANQASPGGPPCRFSSSVQGEPKPHPCRTFPVQPARPPKAEKRKKQRKQPSKKHSLCTLKGAHHPKIRNAVPIVFPRHVDNMVDTSEREKARSKEVKKEGRQHINRQSKEVKNDKRCSSL